MSIEARVVVERDGFLVDAELAVASGEVTAIVGPNGAGKSTILLAIAGLVPLRAGRVALGGVVAEDVATGTRLPPEARGVGMVFQDRLLFPHLSALDNVAFGLRARGARRDDARQRAVELLDEVGMAHRSTAAATELSGGEAQRVAIARALAVEPSVLLLDEPLSALDAGTRREMRGELRRRLSAFGGSGLVVTHDLVDAVGITDRVVVLEDGKVVQWGLVADVCAQPRSRYVADFVGVNLLRGTARAGRVELVGGGTLTAGDVLDGAVLVVVHPRAVALFRERPDGTPRNQWLGAIVSMDDEGERVRILVSGPPELVAEVTPAARHDLDLTPGTPVWVAVKATEVAVYADD
jgi:molybdate transport system ATP-binding protein